MAKGIYNVHQLSRPKLAELRVWLEANMQGKWEIFEVKVIKELWLNNDEDIALYVLTWL